MIDRCVRYAFCRLGPTAPRLCETAREFACITGAGNFPARIFLRDSDAMLAGRNGARRTATNDPDVGVRRAIESSCEISPSARRWPAALFSIPKRSREQFPNCRRKDNFFETCACSSVDDRFVSFMRNCNAISRVRVVALLIEIMFQRRRNLASAATRSRRKKKLFCAVSSRPMPRGGGRRLQRAVVGN